MPLLTQSALALLSAFLAAPLAIEVATPTNQGKKDGGDKQKPAKEPRDSGKALEKALEKLKDAKGAGFEFEFDLKTLDGKPISSKELRGKVVVVDLWGTWCPPCRAEIPHFVEMMKKHEKEPFVVVGLADEDKKQNEDAAKSISRVEAFAKENKINYPLALIDTKTFKQVPGFEGWPTTLFLDKTGKVRIKEVGLKPLEHLDGIVVELLKEKAPAPAKKSS